MYSTKRGYFYFSQKLFGFFYSLISYPKRVWID